MRYLLIGLGNIGTEYTWTRHNIGFLVLDRLATQQAVTFQTGQGAFFTSFQYQGKTLCMIKPTTYMNHSGSAFTYWIGKLKIPVERSLVIVDDLSLPFGKLRIRSKGATAGHNGLKSIETCLGTQRYPRLKFGIGNNFPPGKQADYVLHRFSPKELTTLPMHLEQTCEVILSWCTVGIVHTMARYNAQNNGSYQ